MNNNRELQLLYNKYIHNQLSAEEIRSLLITLGGLSSEDLSTLTGEVFYASSELTKSNADEDSRLTQILANIQEVQHTSGKPVRRKLYTWISVAAAVLIIASVGLFFFSEDSLEEQALAANLKPGANKAILTLANGSHIILDGAVNGTLAKQTGVQIAKTADGQLVYTVVDQNTPASAAEFNSIETPRGGQYKIVLPDHSSVWLNAASSLKYPASFAGSKNRIVELNGEAYFEVAKDKAHPFIVKTENQQVEVLGTHFNINSYTDETISKTTLLEGSVRLSSLLGSSSLRGEQIVLKPGEQGVFASGEINVSQANTEEALAWKNGYFRFNDEKIESVMRKIARWYDVDVKFDGEIPQEEYNGKISRLKNIDQVLDMLGSTKTVHFKIEGRRVLVEK